MAIQSGEMKISFGSVWAKFISRSIIRVVTVPKKKIEFLLRRFSPRLVRVFQPFQMHSLNRTDNWQKDPNDLNMFTNISRLHIGRFESIK